MNELFISLIISTAAVITVILISIIVKKWHLKKIKNLQFKGLSRLQSFREILTNIQKHRELSSDYLYGDYSLLDTTQHLQTVVMRNIQSISHLAEDLESDPNWNNITQHWAKLSANFSQNTADNNLEQHSKLIQSILHLIDKNAKNYRIIDTNNHKTLELNWKQSINIAEYVDQIRTIGKRVISTGSCDSTTHYQLSILQEKIQKSSDLASTRATINEQQRPLQELLDCIDHQLLGNVASISSNQYYQLCTTVIDTLNTQYDESVMHMKD